MVHSLLSTQAECVSIGCALQWAQGAGPCIDGGGGGRGGGQPVQQEPSISVWCGWVFCSWLDTRKGVSFIIKRAKRWKWVKSLLYFPLPCPLRINLASLSQDAVHQDVPLPPLAAGHQGGIRHVALGGCCHAGGGGGAGNIEKLWLARLSIFHICHILQLYSCHTGHTGQQYQIGNHFCLLGWSEDNWLTEEKLEHL